MSHFEVRYLSDHEFSKWDAFVDKSEYGTVFHKTYWSNSLKNADYFTNIDIIGCFNKEGELLAGAMVTWKYILSKFKVMMPPYATCFSGILIEERKSNYVSKRESYRFELINAVLDFLEKKYDSITITFPPEFSDIRAFNWRHYKVGVHYTYYGNLPVVDESKFLPDIKRRIKKAEQTEYEIKNHVDSDHLQVVYDLLSKSYKRQNHLLGFDRNSFIDFCNTDELKSNIHVYSVWLKTTPVSAIVLLVDKGKAYYWLAGGDHHYFETGLNQLLMKKVLENLKDNGLLIMDLVGANTPSISKYKSGYNFELVSYYKIQKNINPIYHFLFNLKKLFRA